MMVKFVILISKKTSVRIMETYESNSIFHKIDFPTPGVDSSHFHGHDHIMETCKTPAEILNMIRKIDFF